MFATKLLLTCSSSSSSIIRKQIKPVATRLYASKIAKQPIKNDCIVSVVGAQSSGKTTLTEAMKKTSAERLNLPFEESIKSGSSDAVYNRFYSGDTRIVQIDVDSIPPKNLMNSAYAADVGLVVVDLANGLTNQTKEHIIILAFHGIKDFIVYLNKTDLNDDDEMRELMIDELKNYFQQRGLHLSDDSIVVGSALNVLKSPSIESADEKSTNKDQQSIVDVLNQIELKTKHLPRDEQLKKPALFSVKRSHLKQNKGVEVTGYMRQGVLKKGDIVNIYGYDRTFKTKIQEIESFKEQLDSVQPGVSAALLLKSVKKSDIQRGMAIVHSDNSELAITDHFKANLYLFKNDEIMNPFSELMDDATLQLFARTFDVKTIIKVENERRCLLPGETAPVLFKVCFSVGFWRAHSSLFNLKFFKFRSFLRQCHWKRT